jgi:hypothetical protein
VPSNLTRRMLAGRLVLAATAVVAVSLGAGPADAGQTPGRSPAEMEAAVDAVLHNLPAEWIGDERLDPQKLAEAVLSTAPDYSWRSMETAPRDRDILLGRRVGSQFLVGVGRWLVLDAETPGGWSTQQWWGGSPTHWAPLPPAPVK